MSNIQAMVEAIQFLEDNLQEPITVGDMAGTASVTVIEQVAIFDSSTRSEIFQVNESAPL